MHFAPRGYDNYTIECRRGPAKAPKIDFGERQWRNRDFPCKRTRDLAIELSGFQVAFDTGAEEEV